MEFPKKLEELNLKATGIEHLIFASELTSLKKITLFTTRVSEVSFHSIAQHCPELQFLTLEGKSLQNPAILEFSLFCFNANRNKTHRIFF